MRPFEFSWITASVTSCEWGLSEPEKSQVCTTQRMMDDDGSWDDTSTPLPVEKRQGHLKHFAEFKENFSQVLCTNSLCACECEDDVSCVLGMLLSYVLN